MFRRKKKEEEYEDEDEDEELEEEDEEEEEEEVPVRTKTLPKLPRKKRKAVRPQQKFMALHQPEMVGIKDEESGEIKEFNIAAEIAEIKSMLWDIQQRL